jgi:hypothetical protein
MGVEGEIGDEEDEDKELGTGIFGMDEGVIYWVFSTLRCAVLVCGIFILCLFEFLFMSGFTSAGSEIYFL